MVFNSEFGTKRTCLRPLSGTVLQASNRSEAVKTNTTNPSRLKGSSKRKFMILRINFNKSSCKVETAMRNHDQIVSTRNMRNIYG